MKKGMVIFRNCIAFLLVLVCTDWVYAGSEIDGAAEVAEDQYIIVLKDPQRMSGAQMTDAGESARQIAERLIEDARYNQITVDARKGIYRSQSDSQAVNELGHIYETAIKGFSAPLTEESVQLLRDNPEVDYIEPDYVVSINATQSPTPSWGLDRIDQENLQLDGVYEYHLDGSSVHVYIVDTGGENNTQEFAGRIGNGYDFIDNDSDADDCNGHGTHVAGTAGGTSFGVAKNAIIHPVRVLNCNGRGYNSQIIAGVDWIAATHASPAVANMSLGGPVSQALDTAVNNAINSGVSFVVSAGNDEAESACDKSPARVPNAITVASSTSSDQRSWFSNIGPCVDIFAPGSSIKSAGLTSDTATSTKSGTSMAAPHVTGVVDLYLEDHASASPAQAANAIISISTPNKISDAGAGTPNRLLYNQIAATPPPPTPHPPHDLAWLVPVVSLLL